jgi:hypothetical protein
MAEQQAAVLAAGCDAFLGKPYHAQQSSIPAPRTSPPQLSPLAVKDRACLVKAFLSGVGLVTSGRLDAVFYPAAMALEIAILILLAIAMLASLARMLRPIQATGATAASNSSNSPAAQP